ncbi:MAG: 2'-deoxycytidine 5'-triphosphate deaminase, partial [SAR324 cluster bacterium]|nr:2'-deoxycytidine 5'-triphosphate deaminase [SAR324 cluster bacterium]
MILSDSTLKRMLASGELIVEPLAEHQLQPASIDLRLGKHFLKLDENDVDLIRMDRPLRYTELTQDEIIIPAH